MSEITTRPATPEDAVARQAGINNIDATIRKYNVSRLTYYGGLGFVDYRETDISVSKKFTILSVK